MKQNFVSRNEILFHETKISFTETKICFNTIDKKHIFFVIFFNIIYNYKRTTSHHKVIKDDASRKTMRITVGSGNHSNFYILQFCYRTKTQ